MAKKINLENIIIILVFMVGTSLRSIMRYVKSDMWHDPAFTYIFSEKPISFILSSNDVHPPFFYILTKLWQMISTNEIFLKSFSGICYTLFFYFLYIYLKKYQSGLVMYLTLLFVSLSPTMIYYSIEYRNYMLGMFFVVAQFYYFRNFIEEKGQKNQILFCLFSVLMLYTHYYTGFALLVEALVIWFYHRKTLLKSFLKSFAVIYLCSVPLIFYLLDTLSKMHSMWFKDITLLSFISTITYQFFPPDTLNMIHILFFISIFIFGFYFLFLKKLPIFHILMFFIPVILVWLISQIHPFYHHRFFLFFSFSLYILVAKIFENLIKNKKFILVWSGFFLLGIFFSLFLFSTMLLPSTLPNELHESQAELKKSLDKENYYVFIHQSPFSQTPMKYYFKDWNTIHYLDTSLTKKERFTAGGSVIEDWEILDDDEEYFCFDACIYLKEKGNYIPDSKDKIYYDNGGLIVYETKERIVKKN